MVEKVLPLHLQIYNRLREDIQNGIYPLGSRLPTEEELSASFNASRPTLRQALTSLSNEGLIMRRPRTGSTVVASQPQVVLSHSVNSVNELLDYPGQMTREIIDSGYIKADQDLARELHCPLHMEWFRLVTLRFQNHATVPLCLTTYYILPKYAGVTKHKKHLITPISEQIVEMFDEAILRAKVEVYSEIIPKKYFSALQITSQDSSLVVMRSYIGKDQQTFQITTSHHPQDRYRYSFELIREHRSANLSARNT
jgi:DNA-binding GntR family transcriptional regulator